MALKQRKQITGTTEQINQYAGVEGQLVWDKSAKTLVGMSGTAGKNYPLAPKAFVTNEVAKVNAEATKKADKTYVDQELAKKASTEALTQGLSGKAPSVHTHTKSQITDFPAIPDTSTLIPKSGNRGTLAGWETNTIISDTELTMILSTSPDVIKITANKTVQVQQGKTNESWTKIIHIIASNVKVNLGGSWYWVGGSAPTIKQYCIIVLHWTSSTGYANILQQG